MAATLQPPRSPAALDPDAGDPETGDVGPRDLDCADSEPSALDPADSEAPQPLPSAASRTDRRPQRLSAESLAERALHLPPPTRALALAYWRLGLHARELAPLHNLTPRQFRRRIEQIRRTLEDPAFVLAALYADRAPPELRELARAYWLHGTPIRTLAASHGHTVYWVRRRLAEARSLLLLACRGERAISPAAAQVALARRNRSTRASRQPRPKRPAAPGAPSV